MGLIRRIEVTLPVSADDFVARLSEQIDTVQHDVPILGSQDRSHPYIGHVNSKEFRLRKRVGLPWDHFSPLCHGTVENQDGRVHLKYSFDRRTRAWWLGWAFVLFAIISVAGMMMLAARDMVEDTDVVANLPSVLVAALIAFGGLCVFLTLKFAGQNAQVDLAEVDYLIRASGDPLPDASIDEEIADAIAAL